MPDGGGRGGPQEGDTAPGSVRAGDPDVHGAEEQQAPQGPLRAVPADQVGHSTPANNGHCARCSHDGEWDQWVGPGGGAKGWCTRVSSGCWWLLYDVQSVGERCTFGKESSPRPTRTSLRHSRTTMRQAVPGWWCVHGVCACVWCCVVLGMCDFVWCGEYSDSVWCGEVQ